jgi:hypothetical protein
MQESSQELQLLNDFLKISSGIRIKLYLEGHWESLSSIQITQTIYTVQIPQHDLHQIVRRQRSRCRHDSHEPTTENGLRRCAQS